MFRRQFIKDSAIIGASATLPILLTAQSGMYSNETYRSVHRILTAGATHVGTLPILRAFAGDHTDHVSPFVLFDEFGPVSITPGNDPLKVDAHPHAGVTPTTFFMKGSGHHKDSMNYDFQIEQGEFMMFNSGKGSIHMEETGSALVKSGGILHGFQIWLNTPAQYKFADPSTLLYQEDRMPSLEGDGFKAKVIMGSLFGHQSRVETYTPTFYYHIEMDADTRLDISTDSMHNAFAYVVDGELEIAEQKQLKKNQIALYNRGKSDINFYSKDGASFFLLGGQPLDEVVYSYGPFVMNNKEQINQCISNYKKGLMGDPQIVNQ